ncbi:hypothetical protein [Nocardia sp. CC227C]|uniref:hypothetical protein n=1 Tax=Nocardia sp. CC227C TaxID=3044562 RepID=UPI00278C062C|nr:hypothetical protein [Nocardia sp. CC227C]
MADRSGGRTRGVSTELYSSPADLPQFVPGEASAPAAVSELRALKNLRERLAANLSRPVERCAAARPRSG